jgi:hypothetical protein
MELAQATAEWSIREQFIDDDVTGLALKFEFTATGDPVLHIYGPYLPHGNREVCFAPDGKVKYLATSVLGSQRPNWTRTG